MRQQRYPTGWNEERVRKLLLHYETQREEEAVAEDEAAFRRRDQTVMVVPQQLVSTITRMIAREGKRGQSSARRPNPYEASVVKRTDGCIAGAGWPSVKHLVSHLCQAFVADLISVAGHSLGLHQTPIEGQCFCGQCSTGNSGARKRHALETLLYPRSGLLKAAGCVQRHS
jgi:hypothetical protein